MLNMEVELNRPGGGGIGGGTLVGLTTPTPVNLEDIVKLLEELPPLEFESTRPSPAPPAPTPNQTAPSSSVPSVLAPPAQQQPRESVIDTNPNVVSSSSSAPSKNVSIAATPAAYFTGISTP